MSEINYKPIAKFRCDNDRAYGAPRQAVLAKDSHGIIVFNEAISRDCFSDLQGFERIWVIYDFHQNHTWKPKVQPPRGAKSKKSVFATRSPYRPNSIGISCVKVEKIEGKKIYVSEHDLLDGTPILDIKPYLPYADSFSQSQTGWVKDCDLFEVNFSEEAAEKVSWLDEQLNLAVKETITNQLQYEPRCRKSKRVKKFGDGYVFSLQAFRFPFLIKEQKVFVTDVFSGYSEVEISDGTDVYSDKSLHRAFRSLFSAQGE